MAALRVLLIVAVLGCLAWGAPFDVYNVSIDTSNIVGPSGLGSAGFALLDNDTGFNTSVSVTDVSGLLSPGLILRSHPLNVTGTFGGTPNLVIGDTPAVQPAHTYLEIFAQFGNTLAFNLNFDTTNVGLPADSNDVNDDKFLFGMAGWHGGVIDLFSLAGDEVIVHEKEWVNVHKVSVPEQPLLSTLLLQLGVLGGVLLWQRRRHRLG